MPRKTGAPDSALVSAVFFSDKGSGKPAAALATGGDFVGLTPDRESVRVDVCAFNDVALSFNFLLGFLRTLLPLFPSGKELVAVFEDRAAGRIIFLPNPGNAGGAGVVIADVGHEITPAMIEIGAEVLLESGYFSSVTQIGEVRPLAERMFRAMLRVRPRSPFQ
jgi:hypothetical protein